MLILFHALIFCGLSFFDGFHFCLKLFLQFLNFFLFFLYLLFVCGFGLVEGLETLFGFFGGKDDRLVFGRLFFGFRWLWRCLGGRINLSDGLFLLFNLDFGRLDLFFFRLLFRLLFFLLLLLFLFFMLNFFGLGSLCFILVCMMNSNRMQLNNRLLALCLLFSWLFGFGDLRFGCFNWGRSWFWLFFWRGVLFFLDLCWLLLLFLLFNLGRLLSDDCHILLLNFSRLLFL